MLDLLIELALIVPIIDKQYNILEWKTQVSKKNIWIDLQ